MPKLHKASHDSVFQLKIYTGFSWNSYIFWFKNKSTENTTNDTTGVTKKVTHSSYQNPNIVDESGEYMVEFDKQQNAIKCHNCIS